MNIPLNSSPLADEWEFRVAVIELPVQFRTTWQLHGAAMKTFHALKERFPSADVRIYRRRLPKVEDITP